MRKTSTILALLVALSGAAASAQDISVAISAPDGFPLATDVYCPLPGCASSWPVVVQRTPYGRRSLADSCRLLNIRGYVCVAQDVRGRGGSGGVFEVFRAARGDGQATVRWAAAQPWSDGRVATVGASASAISHLLLAPGAPPALEAQVAIAATADLYEAAFPGGVLRHSLVSGWLATQGVPSFYQELRLHRTLDAWWSAFSPPEALRSVDVPGLLVTGWYDAFLEGTVSAFDEMQHQGLPSARGRQHLLIGPWTHAGIGSREAGAVTFPPDAGVAPLIVAAVLQFLDHVVKGERNEAENWPPVLVYLMAPVGEPGPGNRWLPLPGWPPPSEVRTLHLGDGAALVDGVPPAAQIALLADPADPVPTVGGAELFPSRVAGADVTPGPQDQRPIADRADVARFDSAPLDSPLAVVGSVRARLWLRPDTRDLDLAVRLVDVHPDGRLMLVADGAQRARMRCGNESECLLEPGQPVALEVEVGSTAYVFNPGHRIGILLSGSNWPRFEVNPNTGEDLNRAGTGAVARPMLLVGPDTPSALELPVLEEPRRVRRLIGQP